MCRFGANPSSYELSCRLVDAGQLPPPSLVHTEDFLAAMDYGFPLPTSGPVGIRTAGWASTLGTGGHELDAGRRAGGPIASAIRPRPRVSTW